MFAYYRNNDWDRSRSERLAQIRLTDRKGRKHVRTPREPLDLDACQTQGIMGIQRQFVTELVKKHSFEREVKTNETSYILLNFSLNICWET